MYLCYIDESGTSQIPGTSSHYILAGLTIPIEKWKQFENDICAIKKKYDLMDSEIHTAWILRSYIEQSKIQDFEKMDYTTRKFEVTRIRNSKILKLQQIGKSDVLKQTKELSTN